MVLRRKHSSAMTDQGLANSSARLFSNPAGDYGSMVNERVGSSQWENGSELGDTWASRNAFSYGRCGPAPPCCCDCVYLTLGLVMYLTLGLDTCLLDGGLNE